MAFVPYVRLVASGLLRTAQSWSIGTSWLVTAPHTQSELLTWLGIMDGLLKTFFGIPEIKTNAWDTTTNYTRLTAYEYTALGGASSQAQIFSSGVTGLGTVGAPAQCALVVSLRSGIGGRNKRGRFYLPYTSRNGMTNLGQAASTDVTNIAAAFKTLVDAANVTHIGTDAVVMGIASRASGFTVVAQDCKIDTKLDTQRRRTDKIPATSSAIAVF